MRFWRPLQQGSGDFKKNRGAREGKRGWQDVSYKDKHALSKEQQHILFFPERKVLVLQN